MAARETEAAGLVRLGVFAPTTLADYHARLRYVDLETDGE